MLLFTSLQNVCRQLHCPLNSSPTKGRCISNSLDFFGFGVRFQLTLVPIKPVPTPTLDTIAVKRVGADVHRKMQLTHCLICSAFMSIKNDNVEGVLQSVKIEIYIKTNHLCQMNTIKTSITETIQNKQFSLKTKQNIIPTIARISYKYLDVYSFKEQVTAHYFTTCKMKIYVLNPVFFCPYVIMSEIEFENFINISQRISNVSSAMASNMNDIRSKFYNLESDKSLPPKYATCVENVLVKSFSGGCQCCRLSTYLLMAEICKVACIVLPFFFFGK